VFPPTQRYFSLPAFTEAENLLSITIYQANIFEAKDDYQLDFAETRIVFHISKKINKKLTLQVYLPFIYAWGGFMDPFIDKFHQMFNFPDAGRGNFEYGRTSYWIEDSVYLFSSDYTGIGEPHLFLTYGRGNIAFRAGFKIPLKKNGFNSGKPGVYTGLKLKTQTKNLMAYLEAGIIFLPESDRVRDHFYSINAGVKYRRVKLGFIVNTSPYRRGDLSHTARAISLQVSPGKGFSLGIVEDLSPYDTSADFTVFVSKNFKI